MFIEEIKEGIRLFVRLSPKAKRVGVEGLYLDSTTTQERVKIAVNAPPVDGKANQELIKLLSKTLKLPKSSFMITAGDTQRNKTLLLQGEFADIKEKILQEIAKCQK